MSRHRHRRHAAPKDAPLIAAVVKILAKGEPTKFRFEATCRHSLRSGFVLNGKGWQQADDRAAAIVAEALRRLGAARPTWQEGQPEATQETLRHYYCQHCGGPITPHPFVPYKKFCSLRCGALAVKKRAVERRGDEMRVEHAAYEIARWRAAKEAMPAKPCAFCGDMFHPTPATKTRPETIYCTPRCRNKARKGTPSARTTFRGKAA